MDAHFHLHLVQIRHQQQQLVFVNISSFFDWSAFPTGSVGMNYQTAAFGNNGAKRKFFESSIASRRIRHRSFDIGFVGCRYGTQIAFQSLRLLLMREVLQNVQFRLFELQIQSQLLNVELSFLQLKLADVSTGSHCVDVFLQVHRSAKRGFCDGDILLQRQ